MGDRFRTWLAQRPGLPVILVGLGYVGFGFAHVWRLESPLPIDWFAVGLYELLALGVLYGGIRLSEPERSLGDGIRVFGATVGFGFVGFVVAAALIALQIRRGVAIVEVWFLMLSASATTAAIGVALALYYIDLQAERRRLASQAETVSELNKRLTVLHRVLRHNLRNELTVIRGHAELLLDRDPAPEVAESLHTLLRHTRQVESLSENAYRLRQVWAEDAVVDKELTELVENCVREAEAAHPEVDITTELPAHVVARVHPRFRLAVSEALENAVVHNDPTSTDVTVTVTALADEPSVEVAVADTGSGIPDFEPGVLEQREERPLDHATGLGLWLIFWVVEQSGGSLQFGENEPQGAVVRMRVPTPEG